MTMNGQNPTGGEILIAQVDVPQDESQGDFYYRTYAPGMGMAHQGGVYAVSCTMFHPRRDQVMDAADVLVLNNICDPDLLPVIRARRQQGKPTVYELYDDISAIPPWNPAYPFYQNPEHHLLIHRLAHTCDALQFSSEELQCKYGYLNPSSVVFPNQILAVPRERRHARKSELVIGWGGSFGHLEDINQIAKPLTAWIMARTDVRLALMCADAIWNLFEALPAERKQRIPTGTLADYYRFVSGLDIGLAPLQNTPFNRTRSDVKFLEYAVHGVVPVMAAAPAYQVTLKPGQTGFLFRNADELIAILDGLVNDLAGRVRVAIAARDYVLTERLQLPCAAARTDFYRALLHGAGAPPRGARESAAETFAAFAALDGARPNGRHLMLLPTAFELHLRQGLCPSTGVSQHEIRRSFRAASDLEPESYLPHLLGAYAAEATRRSLEQAIARNAHSVKAWMLLGEEFSAGGEIHRAIDCFRHAAEISPEYELPYLKMALKLQELGHESQASLMRRRAACLAQPLLR
jgi:hypothetical protein